jgi:hypothetical protein
LPTESKVYEMVPETQPGAAVPQVIFSDVSRYKSS